MGSFYMESTQINYRRDETVKTVDQKLQELSETSAIDTDIAPVFKSTNTYAPGDMVYYRNKLYVFNVEHTGAWAAADVTATDVTTELSSLKSGLINVNTALDVPANSGKNLVDASTFDSYTSDKGITVTPNGTGGIAVSGTNSGTGATGVLLMQAGKYIPLKAGVTYRFSGNWSGVTHGSLTLRMDIRPYNTLDVLASEANGGIGTYTPSDDMNVRVFVRVAGGYAIPSNVVMNPVITTLADTSFTPYIPSVETRLEALEVVQAVASYDMPIMVSDVEVGTVLLKKLSNGFTLLRIQARNLSYNEITLPAIPEIYRPKYITYLTGFSYGDKHRNGRIDSTGVIVIYEQKDSDDGFYSSTYYIN